MRAARSCRYQYDRIVSSVTPSAPCTWMAVSTVSSIVLATANLIAAISSRAALAPCLSIYEILLVRARVRTIRPGEVGPTVPIRTALVQPQDDSAQLSREGEPGESSVEVVGDRGRNVSPGRQDPPYIHGRIAPGEHRRRRHGSVSESTTSRQLSTWNSNSGTPLSIKSCASGPPPADHPPKEFP